jgi:uncharacterized membrane protein YraQ (UPF0718 family)
MFELMNRMWWGLLAGMVFVGLLSKVPREIVTGVLGRGGTLGGIARAMGAGLALDLCSHGILLIGMKLYERGASLGQTIAFLIASPWNSLSLTIILVSLIGLKWTLAFVALSGVIAVLTGLVFERLAARGVLPANPNATALPAGYSLFGEAWRGLRAAKFDGGFFRDVAVAALSESRMILRWIFFGTVLASLLRAVFAPEQFQDWFGPTLAGLGLTLAATTLIEVCTRSWKIALFLPLVSVPQVLVLGLLLNRWFGG